VLKRMTVRNFKSLREVSLDLKPITILLGKNSTGKSSIMDALLLLKQTVESRDVYMPLTPRGNHVDLGGYRDFVNGHHLETDVEIDLELQINPRWFARRDRFGSSKSPDAFFLVEDSATLNPREGRPNRAPRSHYVRRVAMRLVAVFGYSPDQRKTLLKELRVTGKDTDPYLIATPSPTGNGDTFDVSIRVETPERSMRMLFQNALVRKFYAPVVTGAEGAMIFVQSGQPYEGEQSDLAPEARLDLNSISELLSTEMDDIARSIYHIGPLRDYPHRTYVASEETKHDVGLRGETAVEMLYSEHTGRGFRQAAANNVLEWLRRLDMASSLSFPDLSGYAFLCMMGNPKTEVESSIADQGFGVSQILPILVQGFYTEPGSVLLLEEPEIHLHPRAQAELAPLIVDIARRGVRVVAETHSEHIVERLQVQIARSPDLAQHVEILLCDMNEHGTTVRKLAINEEGKRVDWPKDFADGFLNNGLRDAIDLQRAIKPTQEQSD